MSTLSFFNDADLLVDTALRAVTITNSQVAYDATNKIVYRRPESFSGPPKVSIISGGGSGHEPGYASYVGKGLLTAAVAGTVFASPSAEQVRRAILTKVPNQAGVLVLVMRYTGDILNFGIATEKARASGVPIKFLVVGDDVGVGRANAGKVGRRGIAGTTLVVKILGALAESGAGLSDVYNAGVALTQSLASIGASLQKVSIPGREVTNDNDLIPYGQVEVGMGIHNEAGCMRVATSLPDVVSLMLRQLLDPADHDRHFIDIKPSDQVILMVNNLGGLSPLEMSGVTYQVCTQLKWTYHVVPVRVAVGTFLTSLNALGWSISLLRVADLDIGDAGSVLQLYDAPAEAAGWTLSSAAACTTDDGTQPITEVTAQNDIVSSNLVLDPDRCAVALTAGLQALVAAEPEVTRYDTIVGDGDCGVGLKRGAEAILELLSRHAMLPSDAALFVRYIAETIEMSMDGTAGAIFGIFVNAIVSSLQEQQDRQTQKLVDIDIWITALQSALKTLSRYTPANIGDRTFLDSLIPFVEVLAGTRDIRKAAEASVEGAESTKALKASLGRTTYVGNQDQWLGQIPDPGAWGLSKFLTGLASGVLHVQP